MTNLLKSGRPLTSTTLRGAVYDYGGCAQVVRRATGLSARYHVSRCELYFGILGSGTLNKLSNRDVRCVSHPYVYMCMHMHMCMHMVSIDIVYAD